MSGVVLYTAIYGDRYDTVKPVGQAGCRTVLFTDNPDLRGDAERGGWDEVVVDPLERIPTPMLRAKWWKTRADVAVPDAEVSLWIDGSMTPVVGYAERCLKALEDVDIAFTPHPWRDCIYTELAASVGLPKYDAAAMTAQCEGYRLAGHPEHWGLFATGAIARRHVRPVHELGHVWWRENIDHSWQDQLSLPVVVRRAQNIRWAASLPWAQWWAYTDHGVGT
jgi:hypothetical protein